MNKQITVNYLVPTLTGVIGVRKKVDADIVTYLHDKPNHDAVLGVLSCISKVIKERGNIGRDFLPNSISIANSRQLRFEIQSAGHELLAYKGKNASKLYLSKIHKRNRDLLTLFCLGQKRYFFADGQLSPCLAVARSNATLMHRVKLAGRLLMRTFSLPPQKASP